MAFCLICAYGPDISIGRRPKTSFTRLRSFGREGVDLQRIFLVERPLKKKTAVRTRSAPLLASKGRNISLQIG
jgi:hypothetical protein